MQERSIWGIVLCLGLLDKYRYMYFQMPIGLRIIQSKAHSHFYKLTGRKLAIFVAWYDPQV